MRKIDAALLSVSIIFFLSYPFVAMESFITANPTEYPALNKIYSKDSGLKNHKDIYNVKTSSSVSP